MLPHTLNRPAVRPDPTPFHPTPHSQLAADYKANIEECNDDSRLVIGSPVHGKRTLPWTPILGVDYGCEATGSAGQSGSAMYYAVVAPLSRFPCAFDKVRVGGAALVVEMQWLEWS